MAIVCCICGKKQSGWIIDYPLSPELNEYRVCMECGEKYKKIQNAEKLEDVSDEIAYINEHLQKGTANDAVINHFSLLINEDNAQKTVQDIDAATVEQRNEVLNNIMVTSGYNFENYRIIQYCDSNIVTISLQSRYLVLECLKHYWHHYQVWQELNRNPFN